MFLEYFALVILIVGLTLVFYTFIYIHDIPYQIAKKRNHPQAEAIHVACWLSGSEKSTAEGSFSEGATSMEIFRKHRPPSRRLATGVLLIAVTTILPMGHASAAAQSGRD